MHGPDNRTDLHDISPFCVCRLGRIAPVNVTIEKRRVDRKVARAPDLNRRRTHYYHAIVTTSSVQAIAEKEAHVPLFLSI
jgi:hypothetical protein